MMNPKTITSIFYPFHPHYLTFLKLLMNHRSMKGLRLKFLCPIPWHTQHIVKELRKFNVLAPFDVCEV